MGLIKRIKTAIKVYRFYKSIDKQKLRELILKLRNEASEFKEAGLILKKYARKQEVSQIEKEKFREQLIDGIKLLGIGIPFALIPGSSLILPVILGVTKRFNIDLLPSSFKDKNENDQTNNA